MNFLKPTKHMERWLWKELSKSGLTGMIDFAETTNVLNDIKHFMWAENDRYNTIRHPDDSVW